jgi:hypothetical protein
MSDRITWEMCPMCGRRAAVGWVRDRGADYPVESDCPTGCRLTAAQLTQVFRAPNLRPINGRH